MNYHQKQKLAQQRLAKALQEDEANFNQSAIWHNGVIIAQGQAQIIDWLKSQPKVKSPVKMVRIPKPIDVYRRKRPCQLKSPTITAYDRMQYVKGIAQGKYGTSTRTRKLLAEYVAKQTQLRLAKHQRKYGYMPPQSMIKDTVERELMQN